MNGLHVPKKSVHEQKYFTTNGSNTISSRMLDFDFWVWGKSWQHLVWSQSLFLALGMANKSATYIGILGNCPQEMFWVIFPFFGFVSKICFRVGNDGFGLPLFDFDY